jgi:fumarate reductase flavoprotein subunit
MYERIAQELSRRNFVTGATAAVAATAATASIALADDAKADDTEAAEDTAAPENRWQSQAGAAWRQAPEAIDEADIADGGEYDVVIVGGGQSGTWCARSCAMNGLKVAVLEALAEEDFLYVGGEVGHVNSEWAMAHGTEKIDEVELLNEINRRNAGRGNQRLIKDWVYRSGELLDWAIEDLNDSEWMENVENVHVYGRDNDTEMVMDASGYKYWLSTLVFRPFSGSGGDWDWGPKMMTHQREAAIEEGATWMFNHIGYYLEQDVDGKVCAIIAQNEEDESYIRLNVNLGVVLAAGDYSANEDMLRDINDEYRHEAEAYGDIEYAKASGMFTRREGDGIKLGVWAGGHVEVGPHAGMNNGQVDVSAPWGSGFPILNQNGLRFCDEVAGGAEGSGYMIPRQPRGYVASFADANWQEVTKRMPPCHSCVDVTHGVAFDGIDGKVADVEATQPGDAPNEDTGLYCANTLEELVDLLGIWNDEQKATALAELQRYNEMASAGRDEDFGADSRIIKPLDTAPFYAVIAQSDNIICGLCQTTGLDVDHKHRVLDSTLNPIDGLYAIGNNAGNRYCVQYATPLSGMSLGFCLTEGMLLGRQLAGVEE